MSKLPQTNFAHLEQHDEQLLRLGMLAEKYFAEDPNTCLLKLRQLSELLAQLAAAKTGQLVARCWNTSKQIVAINLQLTLSTAAK